MSAKTKRAAKWIHGVVRRHEQALTRYAQHVLGPASASRAADAVQETFLRLWRSDIIGDDGRVKGWLYAVCRNVCVDMLRQDGRERAAGGRLAAVKSFTDPNRRLDARRDLRSFAEVFDTLPERQREVLRLKVEGLTYKEIAAAMALSVANVGWLLHVALKTIRTHLGDDATTAERLREVTR